MGDSMGASAALLFADVADHAMAFCPQVDLVSASIRPGRSARWMRYFRERLVSAVDRAVSGSRRSRVEIHSGTWEHDLAQADFVPDAVGRDRIDAEGLALNVVLHPVDNHRLALALEEGDELLPMVRKAYHEQLAAARAGAAGGRRDEGSTVRGERGEGRGRHQPQVIQTRRSTPQLTRAKADH